MPADYDHFRGSVVARFIAAAAALAFFTGAPGWAVENSLTRRFERAIGLLDSLAALTTAELAADRDELSAGVARGEWSVWAKEAMETILEDVTRGDVLDEAGRPTGRNLQDSLPIKLGKARHLVPSPLLGMYSSLERRVSLIQRIRDETVWELRDATLAVVDSVWRNANEAADLALAIKAMTEFKARAGSHWRAIQQLRRTRGPRIYGQMLVGNRIIDAPYYSLGEAYEVWLVITSPQPLLLPAPERNLAAYLAARREWLLFKRQRYLFVERAPMAAHFEELEAQLRGMIAQASRRLDALIVRDAPAEEYALALQRLESCRLPSSVWNPRQPTGRIGSGVPDFREGMSTNPVMMVDNPMVRDEVLHAYHGWLAFRRAEESGDWSKMTGLENAVARNLPIEVAAHITRRLAQSRVKTMPVAEERLPALDADAPVARLELIRALEELGSREDGEPLRQLAAAWSAVNDAKSVTGSDRRDFSAAWDQLASRPGWHPLFGLRERATREGITAITRREKRDQVARTIPLSILMRDVLNDSLGRGDVAQASRLLSLDRAASALSSPDHDLFVVVTLALTPDSIRPPTQSEQAVNYRQILRAPVDPQVALRVATNMKALMHAAAPPR